MQILFQECTSEALERPAIIFLCVCERERERESVCVCERVRERECVCFSYGYVPFINHVCLCVCMCREGDDVNAVFHAFEFLNKEDSDEDEDEEEEGEEGWLPAGMSSSSPVSTHPPTIASMCVHNTCKKWLL